MTVNIRIGSHGSDDSSLSDEEDSSGVQVSPPSEPESHDYGHDPYDEWAHLPYPDELKPSDSASRPRTSHRTRNREQIQSSSTSRRHSTRRHIVQEREPFPRRARRNPSPESPESIDSGEEYAAPYGRASQERKIWPPGAQGSGYPHSVSPGPSYIYSNGAAQHGPFTPPTGTHAPSDQLIRLGHHSQVGHQNQYPHSVYGYNPQLQQHGPGMPPFYVHEHHSGNHTHQPQTGSHRAEGHHNSQHPFAHQMPSHGPSPYGGSHDLIPYAPGGYYPFREPYSMVPGMLPQYFNPYPRVPSPSQVESSGSPGPTPADTAKDEAIARLERLILEERTEREAREAREADRQAALEHEAAMQAAREERAAREKKLVEEAAAHARAEAEQKAAEEAAKAKKEAEEAAAAAAAEAATAATEAANAAAAEAIAAATAAAIKPPPEKKKPIKFKDAVGRKFSFPFDLCCTWQGMEELIRQAFLHIEVIGPHVAEGHYDLIGPNGDIILPQVWETVVEPDWTITMHMWPIPEKPKTPEPAPAADTTPGAPSDPVAADAAAAGEESKKKGEAGGPKKPRQRAPDPGAFAMWMVGSNRFRLNKALKVAKKLKAVHYGVFPRMM